MLKRSIILFMFFSGSVSLAQEVVSSQGDSYSNANGSIDFTIGEVVINTASNGTNDLTQGFHQTHWNFVGLEDLEPNFDATIFPNPTDDFLNVKTDSFNSTRYTMYDQRGRKVAEGILTGEMTSIPVAQFQSGPYELTLSSSKDDTLLKRFKLVKHQ